MEQDFNFQQYEPANFQYDGLYVSPGFIRLSLSIRELIKDWERATIWYDAEKGAIKIKRDDVNGNRVNAYAGVISASVWRQMPTKHYYLKEKSAKELLFLKVDAPTHIRMKERNTRIKTLITPSK